MVQKLQLSSQLVENMQATALSSCGSVAYKQYFDHISEFLLKWWDRNYPILKLDQGVSVLKCVCKRIL